MYKYHVSAALTDKALKALYRRLEKEDRQHELRVKLLPDAAVKSGRKNVAYIDCDDREYFSKIITDIKFVNYGS